MNEIWKDVLGYEGLYEVSSLGRIRSSKDKTTHSERHGARKWQQRIFKQKTDKNGYKRVTLYKNKSPKDFLVHRLVAIAFIPQIEGKELINHIDCNPSNNYASNLEWCNHSENLKHAYENRLNQSNEVVILLNTITNKPKVFLSKSEASEFLGRNKAFLSGIINKGINEVDEYEIFSKV
ncbi:NUMOD4 motif-containing HNH endonuclease [Vagococcus fluvialis]|uniref:NUMOD4 motif-containing HNH endonuclease n=1 Tax=Vagococcus fluvialis TaxID=2738 RepID=UPI001A8C2E8E|nr:NUMOD4 motif-containing HNH endonuclease [Vagococcus fluvialis]MBO0479613.1 NUMOD4 motif-containing HNH endonuclease [Vagococcus fluvialis]MBO0485367.1 NUMOD4 motif-containing HNH endonuclease [Vagococcus fluvialis]